MNLYYTQIDLIEYISTSIFKQYLFNFQRIYYLIYKIFKEPIIWIKHTFWKFNAKYFSTS